MANLWCERALLPDGWAENVRIVLSGRSIVQVDANVAAGSDERHAIVVPGIGNVHSHAFQRGMAGLAEHRGASNDDFWSWREVMYRFLDRLDPDDVRAIAAQAYVEMIETGYTHVGEFHYLHNAPDGRAYADRAVMAAAVADAAGETGIGMTLLPVFYAHGGAGGAAPREGQRRFVTDLDGFAHLVDATRALASDGDITGVAPHSLRAVTPEELIAVTQIGRDGPIHIHAAEQTAEVDACVAVLGARPVEWLLANAAVDRRWTLIHATHLTDGETDALAASNAVAGLCPVTEANLGDGIFPAARYLQAGGRWATGTDSNILIDPAQELRALEYSQRLARRQRVVLADAGIPSVGTRLFEGACAGAAQSLGIGHGIAVGQPADLVALDAGHPALCDHGTATLLDGWIFAARSSPVDAVWRGGVRLVSQGRHRDREAVLARYRATLRKLVA